MRIYNVGSYPISCTGNSQKRTKLDLRQSTPVVAGQILGADEFAESIKHFPKGKDESTLNYLYKYMPIGAERKLENFNGERRISVVRAQGCMKKVTETLYPYQAKLVRLMKNVGTNENPKLKTSYVSLTPENSIRGIEVTVLDDGRLFLEIKTDEYYGYVSRGSYRRTYDNWHDLYQNDRPFMDVLSKITKKNFYKYLKK